MPSRESCVTKDENFIDFWKLWSPASNTTSSSSSSTVPSSQESTDFWKLWSAISTVPACSAPSLASRTSPSPSVASLPELTDLWKLWPSASPAEFSEPRPKRLDHIDLASLVRACDGSKEVTIYGWANCKYEEVDHYLREKAQEEDFPIDKVYDYELGSKEEAVSVAEITSLEGRKLNRIGYDRSQAGAGSVCKTALTDVVLENYKRLAEGKTPIRVLFCADIDGNPHTLQPEHLTSRDPKFNQRVTIKELRRSYKLCNHPDPKIRHAAFQTFRFIKVKEMGKNAVSFEMLEAPWQTPTFSALWAVRKSTSTTWLQPKPYKINWVQQMAQHVAEFDAEFTRRKRVITPPLTSFTMPPAALSP